MYLGLPTLPTLARRFSACALVGLTGTSACVGGDSDNTNHLCPISYEGYWYETDLELIHTEPRHCPIPVPGHGGGMDQVDFAATVYDRDGDDAEDNLYLDVINGIGNIVEQTVEPFYLVGAGPDTQAAPYITYLAATGTLYGGGDNDDEAELVIPLQSPDNKVAIGRVLLQTLFGQRNTSLSGPSDIPLSGNCVYTASSTLNGASRTGMTNRWYVDGNYAGAGDSFVPWPETEGTEGMHDIEVRATDQYGYVTSDGTFIHLYPSAPPCQ